MIDKRSILHRKAAIVVIFITSIIFLLIIYNETPLKKGKSTFYLQHSSIDAVMETLLKNGYNVNRIDRFVLQYATLPKEGWYMIDKSKVGRYFFLKDLHKMRARTIHIVVFAGETKEEMFHRLSNDMLLDQDKLAQYYKKFSRFEEGNIVTGKYTLALLADEETVMRYLVDRSNEKLDSFARREFGYHFSEDQLLKTLIIASIIQKESNNIKEMSYISSVVRNRLKKGMRLQMDGTLNYGKYSHTIVTPERIKSDTSQYNTYKHKGLIPAPLSNVSMDSLQAAASPLESDYLFFVLNDKGKHVFAKTYKKHLKNVKAFKIFCQERIQKKRDEELKRQKLSKRDKACQKVLSNENNESNATHNNTIGAEQNLSKHTPVTIGKKRGKEAAEPSESDSESNTTQDRDSDAEKKLL